MCLISTNKITKKSISHYHLYYKQLHFFCVKIYDKYEKYATKNLHTFNICHTFAVTKSKTNNA